MHPFLLFLSATAILQTPSQSASDLRRWERQARAVTIVRDDWGIAHVHGKTDADAVFGMIYAQAEDDFNRVETNYLNSIGRLAEAEGEKALWQDLRMKLFIDPDSLRAKYAASPEWLQAADGRLGRRAQLLPAHASRGEAAGHHPVRAVDGAQFQRGQHRRRHREHIARRAPGVLRRQRRASRRRPIRAGDGGAVGLERLRHRAGEHRKRPRAPADQSAHLVLLPLRAADDERRGAQRLWRGDVGPVLHLPGIQRPAGLDAHLDRRGCDRRIRSRRWCGSGDRLFYSYGSEERPLATAPDHGAVPDRSRAWRADTFTVYRTHHGPIVRRRAAELDQRAADGEADRGAEPVVPPDQGADSWPSIGR